MKKIAANLCAGFRVGKLTVERPTEAISSGNAAASVAKRIFWIPALCRGGQSWTAAATLLSSQVSGILQECGLACWLHYADRRIEKECRYRLALPL